MFLLAPFERLVTFSYNERTTHLQLTYNTIALSARIYFLQISDELDNVICNLNVSLYLLYNSVKHCSLSRRAYKNGPQDLKRHYGIEEGRVGLGAERANEGTEGAAVEKAPKNSEAKPVTSYGFRSRRNCRKSASRACSSGCRLM